MPKTMTDQEYLAYLKNKASNQITGFKKEKVVSSKEADIVSKDILEEFRDVTLSRITWLLGGDYGEEWLAYFYFHNFQNHVNKQIARQCVQLIWRLDYSLPLRKATKLWQKLTEKNKQEIYDIVNEYLEEYPYPNHVALCKLHPAHPDYKEE